MRLIGPQRAHFSSGVLEALAPRATRRISQQRTPVILVVLISLSALFIGATAAGAVSLQHHGGHHHRHTHEPVRVGSPSSPTQGRPAQPEKSKVPTSTTPPPPTTTSAPTTTTAAAAAGCLDLGISSNYQWSSTFPNAAVDLPRLKTYGVGTIREDIFWSIVQPNGPTQWNWSAYDRLFTMASQQGLNVLPIIGYGTGWASAPGTWRDMPTTPVGQAAYATYAAAVVARYGPDGSFWAANPSLRPRPFSAVELWNEPWFAGHAVAVGTYVRLLELAGAAIKAIAPSITTLANVDDRGTTITDSKYVLWGQAVLQYASQLTPVIDGWAIHPYSAGQWTGLAPADDSMRQLNWLQGLLTAGHIPGRIWITELGFSTAIAAPYSPSVAYTDFLTDVRHMTGPNAPQHIFVFSAARVSAGTKPGSWDYGYNLVGANGEMSSELDSIAAARCAS